MHTHHTTLPLWEPINRLFWWSCTMVMTLLTASFALHMHIWWAFTVLASLCVGFSVLSIRTLQHLRPITEKSEFFFIRKQFTSMLWVAWTGLVALTSWLSHQEWLLWLNIAIALGNAWMTLDCRKTLWKHFTL